MERVKNMNMNVGKKWEAVLAMALLCALLLSGNASAASLVVLDLAEIVDRTAPSVVEVFTETKQVSGWFQEYVTEGAGSGVVLTGDGYIVTNRHVIDGAGTVKVRLNNGQLGVSVARLTRPGQSAYFDQPGVYVAQVTGDNGLKVGDRLLRIDGGAIQSTADISAVLDRHSVGDTVKVELVRNGKQTAVNVTLTEKGPE